jgi:hypothetical protein
MRTTPAPTHFSFRRILATLLGAAMICGFTGCATNFAKVGKPYTVKLERKKAVPKNSPARTYDLVSGRIERIHDPVKPGDYYKLQFRQGSAGGAPDKVTFKPGQKKVEFTIVPAPSDAGRTLIFIVRGRIDETNAAGVGAVAVEGADDEEPCGPAPKKMQGVGSPISVGRH